MFQTFARSWKGLNLSPGERAAMKLTEGVLVTAVGSGVLVAVQQVSTGTINVHEIALLAGGSAFGALYATVKKYLAAQTDVPLADPSLVSVPKETPAPLPLSPPVPMPGSMFTTPVPAPPLQFVPNNTTTFMQPPTASTSYVPPQPIAFDPAWSGMVPSVSSQTTERIPTP